MQDSLAPPRACPWCSAGLDGAVVRPPGLVLCSACGVATTTPWPSDAALEQSYGGWYRPESGRFGRLGDAFLRRSRARLAQRIDRVAPPGRVLDVGCGEGALLDALRGRGREAVGLERRSTRPDVREQDVVEVEGSWAAVVFWHSLEHLREPGEALRHAAGLLLPGGVLYVALPNFASLQSRIFEDRWFALDVPRHLVHVPAGALTDMLTELGLQLERVSHLRGGQVLFGWLHGLVGRLPGCCDLYDAIRTEAARLRPVTRPRRALTLLAAAALSPLAACLTAIEVALRRGGTVYVEARRPAR